MEHRTSAHGKPIPEDWVPTPEGGWQAPPGYEEPAPKRQARQRPVRRPDAAGQKWHAKAAEQWEKAVATAPDDPLSVFEAPALPGWRAPSHVKRELLGRYLENRDTGQVHDVEHATAECRIDAIANGTFYHFESELPDELDDHECMGAD